MTRPALTDSKSRPAFWLTGLLAAALFATGLLATAPAAPAAQALVPCDPVKGGEVLIDGEATIVPQEKFRRKLRGLGLRLSTVTPANNFTGRPTFPVENLNFGGGSSSLYRVKLAGGIKFSDGIGGRVRLNNLKAVLENGDKSYVTAKKGANKVRVFDLRGGRLKAKQEDGELRLTGARTLLTGAGARFLRQRLEIEANGSKRKPPAPLRKGSRYGKITIFAYRQLAASTNPEGEAPVPPPEIVRPETAVSLLSAKIKWRVRESFIQYVGSGDGTRTEDGAFGDPSEVIGSGPLLTYAFNFPFTSGWTDEPGDSAAVYGSGLVGFRYCQNTINFTVSDPEVELNGDSSRLIFRVNGIDGTPYPDSRAVVVDLRMSQAVSVSTVGDTTNYTGIPGYIPGESTGVFADIYPAGVEFGSIDLELTKGP
ncbi:MAG: HtaA domain-containing protein [Thermoleophilia bacterium]|nr:HtaA domain-containing protein [Thermoleophilia bacterium]